MNDTANPLVSVVIPTYNHASYLGRALQSVLIQTYTNWEAIVIDNHSTDKTDEVMASFTDSRITFKKIHNKGVIAASRNAGIRSAKGEWIAFLDSDDWWVAEKLQFCSEVINDKVDFIYHDLEIVADQPRYFRQKIIKSWQVKPPVLIDLMVRGSAIATSSAVARTDLLKQLKGMNESSDMVAAEDYNMWLRIAQLTDGFKYVSKRLGFYQLHNQGISSRKDMSVPSQHAAAEFIPLLIPQQKKRFEANLSYTRGRFNYLAGNYMSAKKNLIICILNGPRKIIFKAVYMYITAIIFENIDFKRFNK
jgi:glycosyltransferase involved in cell wall biosynthesis